MSDDFESQGAAAAPVSKLSDAQAYALMQHLAYWFEQVLADDLRPEPGTVLRDY